MAGRAPDSVGGGALVSKGELRQVLEYARGTHESIIRLESRHNGLDQKVDKMGDTLERLTTSSVRAADIQQERWDMEKEERAAARAAAEREEKEAREARKRVGAFVTAHWKYLLLIGLLLFYPEVAAQLQTMGLFPSFQQPVAAAPPVGVEP